MLGLYVWRALVRSTAVSLPAPYVIDADEQPPEIEVMEDNCSLLESMNIDLDAFPSLDLPNVDWPSNDDGTNYSILAKELYQAAQAWATNLVDFVWLMALHKVDEFWHSCRQPSTPPHPRTTLISYRVTSQLRDDFDISHHTLSPGTKPTGCFEC